MNLKDLKLNDLIKIALAVTAILALTFNIVIASNNTTIINNYIDESTKKLSYLEKSNNETQSNVTKVKEDVNKTLIITQKILRHVD